MVIAGPPKKRKQRKIKHCGGRDPVLHKSQQKGGVEKEIEKKPQGSGVYLFIPGGKIFSKGEI